MKVTTDDLLSAILAAAPIAPGPEWKTVKELIDDAAKQGHNIRIAAMGKRLRLLAKDGKIEIIKAPRRGTNNGVSIYYRLKNGRR